MPTKGINGSWLYIRHLWSLRPPTSFSGSFFLETRLTIRHTKNWPRQTFQIWTPASVTLRVPSLLLLSVFTRLVPTPHYPARACAIRVMWFERRLSRLRHRNALIVKAWEEAVQGQGNVFTSSNFHMSDYRKWSNKRPRCLFNFRGPGRWKAFKTERGVYSHNYNKHNKTSTFSAKKTREFKNRGISTPSVDMSRPFNNPYRFFKFQRRC